MYKKWREKQKIFYNRIFGNLPVLFFISFLLHRTEPCVRISPLFYDDPNIFLTMLKKHNLEYHNWETKDDRNIYTYMALFLYHLFPNKKAVANDIETTLVILSVPIRRLYHVLSCLNRIQVLFMRLSQWNIHRTICDLSQSTYVIEFYFRTTWLRKRMSKIRSTSYSSCFFHLDFTLLWLIYSFTILSNTMKLISIMYKIWHVKLKN